MFGTSFFYLKPDNKKGLFYLRFPFNQILFNKLDKNRKKVATNLSKFIFKVITKFSKPPHEIPEQPMWSYTPARKLKMVVLRPVKKQRQVYFERAKKKKKKPRNMF